jgi:hypothetical protein
MKQGYIMSFNRKKPKEEESWGKYISNSQLEKGKITNRDIYSTNDFQETNSEIRSKAYSLSNILPCSSG